MTNNFPRVTAILSRIPDAATRWPWWHWPVCPECGKECEYDSTKDPFCDNPDCHVHFEKITPVYRFAPPTDGDGPDVWRGGDTSPENMHHLWEVLRAVDFKKSVSVFSTSNGYRVSVFLDKYGRERIGRDPNIIEAMLRCLEVVVGVDTTKENEE